MCGRQLLPTSGMFVPPLIQYCLTKSPWGSLTYVLLLLIVSSSIKLVVVDLMAYVVGGSCFPPAVCMSLPSYNVNSLDPPGKPLTYVLLLLIVNSS